MLFIPAYGFFIFGAILLVSRKLENEKAQDYGIIISLTPLIAGIFDVIENTNLLLMLYDDAFINLIKIGSMLAGSKVLWVFWSGPLLQYQLMATGVYLLSRKCLNNNYTPLIAAIIPLWFMGNGTMNDLIFLLRRNILMALVPYIIIYLLLIDVSGAANINANTAR